MKVFEFTFYVSELTEEQAQELTARVDSFITGSQEHSGMPGVLLGAGVVFKEVFI